MVDATLSALRAALESAVHQSDTLPLDQQTLGDPGRRLPALLEEAFGAGRLVLQGDATITADDALDLLVVTGVSTVGLLGVTRPTVRATFGTAADPDRTGQLMIHLDLVVETDASWSLAATFPKIATTPVRSLAWDAGTPPRFRFRSRPGPADEYGVPEPVGLSLEATVDVARSPVLATIARTLPEWQSCKVAMCGAVAASAGTEHLTLRGAGPDTARLVLNPTGSTPIALDGLAVELSATATPTSAGDTAASVSLRIWGRTEANGDTFRLAVEAPLVTGPWVVGLPAGDTTLRQVMGLLPDVPLLDALPDELKNAATLRVTTLTLALTPDRSACIRIQVIVQSDPATPLKWVVVPGVVELETITVSVTVDVRADGGHDTTGWVYGSARLGACTILAGIPLPLTAGPITVTARPDARLDDLAPLATIIGGQGLASLLPPKVASIAGGFTLRYVSLVVDPANTLLTEVSLQLAAHGSWTVVPGLTLDSLSIDVDLADPLRNPTIAGQLRGVFHVGDTEVDIVVERYGNGPWQLRVISEDIPLPSVDDLKGLVDLRDTLPESLTTARFRIASLELDADLSTPRLERFALAVDTTDTWKLVPGYLEIDQLLLRVVLDWTSGARAVSGAMFAEISITDEIVLAVSADRHPDGAWVLAGQLAQPVRVGDLVQRFIPTQVPDAIAGLVISTLAVTVDTGRRGYRFDGALTWSFPLGGANVAIAASATVGREPDPHDPQASVFSGELTGSLATHFGSNQLDLAVGYRFQGRESVNYTFTLGFNGLRLAATFDRSRDGDSVLTVRLTGITFGEVVEFLVNLVDPALRFSLGAPWDVLNQIRFDDFTLVANLTRRTIGVRYDVDRDLGLVDVRSVTLTFLRRGGRATVDIAMTGRFLDDTYHDAQPLTWDLLNAPPPQAGKGTKLLDLRYLGLGQHLVLADPAAGTRMQDVLDELEKTVVSASTGDVRPWQVLAFDPSAGVLVGALFTVLDTVTIGLVFDDPQLYGVRVALSGEKAGAFRGLDFQILYRKVTDAIGVYHIELKLPDLLRHLEFGPVALTLPVVVLDIYTNGDFAVDLGFPYRNDWSRCFAVDVFPFLGLGGFAFAKLSGATSTHVPKITNGTFDPVIEFGIALAVGVGKEAGFGPLRAGVSVAVQGVLQGVVAWFDPADATASPDRYYDVTGTVAVVGKLYGVVDFKIITVSVSVVAYASVAVAVRAHEPLHLGLSVGVTVTASIKVLFIRVHFTFSIQLDASFTIGSASTPPWALSPANQPTDRWPANRRRRPRALAPLVPPHRVRAGEPACTGLTWTPAPVLGTAPVPVDIQLMPVFTAYGEGPLSVAAVMVPFVRTAATHEPVPADGLRAVRPGAGTATLPFHILVAALLKWGVHALLGRSTGPVTGVDLHLILDDLSAPDIADRAFGYQNLADFLAANLILVLGGPNDATQTDSAARTGSATPTDGAARTADATQADEPPQSGGCVLPIMPPLQMTPGAGPTVRFRDHNRVGPAYEQQIADLVARVAVPYDHDTVADPAAPPRAGNTGGPPHGTDPATRRGDDTTESLATVVFRDYLLLLTKAVVQSAADALRSLPHPATSADSLAGLAARHSPTVAYAVRAGDSAASIATEFAVDPGQLAAANPTVEFTEPLPVGTALRVPPPMTTIDHVLVPAEVTERTVDALAESFHTTGAAIRAANPGTDLDRATAGTVAHIPVPAMLVAIADANLTVALAAGVDLPLGGVRQQTRADDTLDGIAARFGLTGPVALAERNSGDPAWLRTGATLTVAAAATPTTFTYVATAGDTLDRVAAHFWVRDHGVTGLTHYGWYAYAIRAADPTVDFDTVGGPSPVTLTIPDAVLTDHGLAPAGTTQTYASRPGDTLALVAGYFAAARQEGVLDALARAIHALNPTIEPGVTVRVPALPHTVAAGETLDALSARFGVTVADLASVNARAGIVAPNATLVLPPTLAHRTGDAETLASLASAYGLTLDALVAAVAAVPGLFATTVTIPDVRQADVDALVDALCGTGRTNLVAGMVSRFLLHGLRLPDPAGTAGPQGLYALTGQQFALADPPTAAVPVAFETPDPAPWLALATPYVTRAGDTLASILHDFGLPDAERLGQLNPGVDLASPATGTALRIPRTRLDVDLTVELMTTNWPGTTLDPRITKPPARLPLAQETPVRRTMTRTASWQAAQPPDLGGGEPTPIGGQPSLWALPADLPARIARDATPQPYEAMVGLPVADRLDIAPVRAYAWATVLPLDVERLPAERGFLAHTYRLVGVPQVGRDDLLALWSHLASGGGGATLALLHPAPVGEGGAGLRSDALDRTASAVLKTNLSTETHSGAATVGLTPAAVPPAGRSYATIAAARQFLQLVWECSVTNSGGFFLTYATTTGEDLPASVFAGGDTARLTLVVVLDEHTGPAPGRLVHPFTGHAVVLDTIDPVRATVFAKATDGSDLTRVCTVPPGTVGFELSRANASLEPDSAGQRTRSLASMLAWSMTEPSRSGEALVGLPIGPTESDTADTGTRAARPLVGANADPSTWHYHQVVPVSRFAVPAGPLPKALPAPEADPYAGLGAVAHFDLTFQDVFGNPVHGDGLPPVRVGIGYTDPVLGVATWPGATASYTVAPAGGQPALTVELSLDPARYLPAAELTPLAAARAAAAAAAKYRQVSYQLRQPDVTCTVTTSLDGPGAATGRQVAVKRALRAFVDSSYLFLSAAASLAPVEHRVTAPTETLDAIAAAHHVPLAALAATNAGADAHAVFATAVTVPRVRVVAAGDTLDSLARATGVPAVALLRDPRNAGVPLTPDTVLVTGVRAYTTQPQDTLDGIGILLDTTPAAVARANAATSGLLAPGVTVTLGGVAVVVAANDTFATLVAAFATHRVVTTPEAVAEANATVPAIFAPGVTLAVAPVAAHPTDPAGIRTHTIAAGDTLASVAAGQCCAVGGLATANAQLTGLLRPDVTFHVGAREVTVRAGDTFATIATGLRGDSGQPVGVAEVAVAAATVEGLLVAGATVRIAEYVTRSSDTFADVLTAVGQVTLEHLVAYLGAGPAGILSAGSRIVYGATAYRPVPGQTLEAVAAATGGTVGDLVTANGATPLRVGAVVEIPGAVRVEAGRTRATAGYQARPTDTLAAIATAVGGTPATVACANDTMPGLFVAGRTITCAGRRLTTSERSTFASLAAEAGTTVAAFAADAAVRELTGLIAPGALFVVDLPAVAGRCLAGLATDLDVPLADLARANSALTGLLRAGARISAGTGTPVEVAGTDTLQSIVHRFGTERGIALTVADLAEINRNDTALLAATATVLVPPRRAELSCPLPDVFVPAPLFPLAVTIAVERSRDLVDAEFADIAAVRRHETSVPPLPGGGEGDASLVPLATAFEVAFAQRRLRLAGGPRSATGEQQVWVVNHADDGLAGITADSAGTRFFAVPPLSTELVSAENVAIRPYDPATGGTGAPTPRSFHSVDLDGWLRELLSAVDLVLGPSYAAPLFRIGARQALDDVLAAKESIALALGNRVTSILEDGTVPGAGLEAARDALHQSMRVSLSSAYRVDAVIQVPLTVDSPYGRPYLVAAGDRFAQVAAYYGVGRAAVARALADNPGILTVGVTARHGGTAHVITAGDTLRSVAAALGSTIRSLPDDLTLDGPAGLFRQGVTINRVTLRRTPRAADSFRSLAAYFGTDVATVAVANADVVGVFAVGTAFVIGARRYDTRAGDTLATVAAVFGLAPERFAEHDAVRDVPGVFSAATTLASFSDQDHLPPRLSGQPWVDLYRCAADETFAHLVGHYRVADHRLADLLADLTGILAVGTRLTLDGRPAVTIRAVDTLGTLATGFGVTVVELLRDAVSQGGGGLFATGVVLPIRGLAARPGPADTLATVADQLQTTMPALLAANQDEPGLVLAGTNLHVGGASHVVQANDTLRTIATALGTDLTTLAGVIAATPRSLDTGKTWHDVQPMPAVSLSTVRTSLATGTSYATVLCSSTDVDYRSLLLDLTYPADEIEFDVRDVAGVEGYQDSRWLRLVNPATPVDLGGVEVPIPLRRYPALPTLLGTSAVAAWPDATDIASAKRWLFDATVAHQESAQDSTYLRVTWNSATGARLATAPDALVAALAQFTSIWPALSADLARLPALPSGTTGGTLTTAAATFATAVSAVAAALAAGTVTATSAGPGTLTYRLDTTYDHSRTPPTRSALTLVVQEPDAATVVWPDVFLPAGPPLRADAAQGPRRTYYYPEPQPAAFTELQHRFVLPQASADRGLAGFDAAVTSSAAAQIMLTRNERLVRSRPTGPPFVYRTPWVSAPDPASPAIVTVNPIVIGSPGDLHTAVARMLTALLVPASGAPATAHPVSLSCRYAVLVAPDGTPPVLGHLPAFHLPPTRVGGGDGVTIDALAARVGEHLATWITESGVGRRPGEGFVFELSLFEPGGGRLSRPLVRLRNLRCEY